jgi:hypothetical protein
MEPDTEAQLKEFLTSAAPLRKAVASIADWQNGHDAEHRKLQNGLESQSFRLQSLEAATGRGWSGAVRTIVLVLIGLGGGYVIRGSSGATTIVTQAPAARP